MVGSVRRAAGRVQLGAGRVAPPAPPRSLHAIPCLRASPGRVPDGEQSGPPLPLGNVPRIAGRTNAMRRTVPSVSQLVPTKRLFTVGGSLFRQGSEARVSQGRA